MRRSSGALVRFGPLSFVLLAVVCFAAAGQARPPDSEQVGIRVAHNLTSSQLTLNLSGVHPSWDAQRRLANPPPNWQVLDAAGKPVASGKFEFG